MRVNTVIFGSLFTVFFLCSSVFLWASCGDHKKNLDFYYWKSGGKHGNFGDELSFALIQRIFPEKKVILKNRNKKNKLLAIGSIIHIAQPKDVIWGSGINGKRLDKKSYSLKGTKILALRGPLSKKYIEEELGISCPTQVFGDPALLFPFYFPEYKKIPKDLDYIVIPHMSEINLFKNKKNVVYPTEPWNKVVTKICQSRLVISSSLHGIIVAEAFGIPAILLKVTNNEPLFKYKDYYWGSGRKEFPIASSIQEALTLLPPHLPSVDLKALIEALSNHYDAENIYFPDFQ